jgi:hypothetical protein
MSFLKSVWSKVWAIITEMNWTVAGTILVLITLSGATKTTGYQIFIIACIINVLHILFQKSDTEDT